MQSDKQANIGDLLLKASAQVAIAIKDASLTAAALQLKSPKPKKRKKERERERIPSSCYEILLSLQRTLIMDRFPSEGFREIITFMQDCKYNLGFFQKKKRKNKLFYFHADVNTAILLLIKFTKFPYAWRERHYVRAIARILEVCYETNYRDCAGFRAMLKSFKPSVVRIISDVYIEELRLGDKVGFLRYILEMLAECRFDLGEKCAIECTYDETSIESLMNTRIFWNALGHGSFGEIMVLLQHDYPIMIEIYHRMGNW